MKLLTNPLVLRMVVVSVATAAAFLAGLFAIRSLRKRFQQEGALDTATPETGNFSLQTYHAVIQQLKQQKHELQSLQQQERRRAKATENVSAAVLSNLSCGVVFFNTAGLVRQANAAAKHILGYASPVGMSASDLFRGTVVRSIRQADLPAETLAQAVASTLRSAAGVRGAEVDYVTPSGEERILDVTVSPVWAANSEVLGAACLINDQTEMVQLRRNHELHGEMSAEMALALRNSLATISGFAKQLAAAGDPKSAERLAADIAYEAEHLEHSIGGFLAGARAAKSASGMV